MGKFEALFQRPGIERSKSEMPSHIPRSDFNKVYAKVICLISLYIFTVNLNNMVYNFSHKIYMI